MDTFNSKTNNIILLSDIQKNEIMHSQIEYQECNHFKNITVNNEIEKWLSEEYNSDILKAEEDIKNSNAISHQDVKSKIEEWKIKSSSNN